jgi:hypothetical protein
MITRGMRYLADKELLPSNIFDDSLYKTWTKISYDFMHKESMYESGETVISIDKFAEKYAKEKGLSCELTSADAVFVKNRKLIFVEFKNGLIDKKEKYIVIKKMYDSFIMYCDIRQMTIKEFRDISEFILVYNGDKNQQTTGKEKPISSESKKREKDEILPSSGYNAIVEESDRLSHNEERIRFNLDKYKGYLYSNVHTYTRELFAAYMK